MIDLADLHVVAHGATGHERRQLENPGAEVPLDELPGLLLRTVHRHTAWRTVGQWSCEISLDHGRRARPSDVRRLLVDWRRRGIVERTAFLCDSGKTSHAYRFARST